MLHAAVVTVTFITKKCLFKYTENFHFFFFIVKFYHQNNENFQIKILIFFI